MPSNLLFVHALTSIHPGTGQGVGAIDLPIARERATNLPIVQGSSLKGSLRAAVPDKALQNEMFGQAEIQGKLRVSDARLLLLPVRCPGSIFAWVTSRYVLRRFQRECNLLGIGGVPSQVFDPGELDAHLPDGSIVGTVLGGTPRFILEDLSFEISKNPEKQKAARAWAEWLAARVFPGDKGWAEEFIQRLAILGDANFDFLAEFATEVTAHIKIGDDGTVVDGALWYEETLPAETILYSVVEAPAQVKYQQVIPAVLKVGGNATTGQGLVRLVLGVPQNA